ncbi:hypothetical protein M758_4G169000 [Ceratodon purpureus]|nr:hypothetical protein M758_4G169000 [Ceratodon purpureus]
MGFPAMSSRTPSLSVFPTGFPFKSSTLSDNPALSCCFMLSATSLGLSPPSVTDSRSPLSISFDPALTLPGEPGPVTASAPCAKRLLDAVKWRTAPNAAVTGAYCSPSTITARNAISLTHNRAPKSFTSSYNL